MKLALCGNPNVGKTTLFNRLTRSDEPVGNWHGVTVDVKTKRSGKDVICDLPGAYSLTARTAEEAITRDEALFGDSDVIVCVAEANNLRRNLYILLQLLEAGKRTVLVVNMMDEARGKVDLDLLSERLGVPVVGTSEKYKNPRAEIFAAAKRALTERAVTPEYFRDERIASIARRVGGRAQSVGLEPVYCAIKLIERDGYIEELLCGEKNALECRSSIGVSTGGRTTHNGTALSGGLSGGSTRSALCAACAVKGDCECDLPAALRYAYIDKITADVVDKPRVSARTLRIDRVILGKATALPVFLLVMAAVFMLTFEAGRPLSALLSALTEKVAATVRGSDRLPEWAAGLLGDGVIGGVGAVLAFLPQVVMLFALTALLQDSGYMSRVAFITDGFFKKFGLSGRAAFSVVLGLGCSATAVLSTRGISGERARVRTAFCVPFCPCSARLAVFTAIAAYFELSGAVVAVMYALGVASALCVLKIAQAFLPDERTGGELIMEMPPYRLPRIKRVAVTIAHNVWSFVARVGSTVLCMSIIMWVPSNFSIAEGFVPHDPEKSVMATFAGLLAPIFAPLGFGSWKAVAALLSGIAAKETVVSVIAGFGGMGEVLGSSTAAVSFMIFTCLYVPCAATVSALAKETGGRVAAVSAIAHTAAAYLSSLTFYRLAVLFESDKSAFILAVTAIAIAVATAIYLITAYKDIFSARLSGRNKKTKYNAEKSTWERNTSSL